MCHSVHHEAWYVEASVWHKEILKIDKERFICEIADCADAVERYIQFLCCASYTGRFHLYYDGTGPPKFPFFFGCSRDVWAGMDEAGLRLWSVGVEGWPSGGAVGHGGRDDDIGDGQGRIECAAGSDADDAGEIVCEGLGGLVGCCRAFYADATGDGDGVAVSPFSAARPVDGQIQHAEVIPARDP